MTGAVPVKRHVRPESWAFAMDFLGDPEASEVEAYVAKVEADARFLAAWLQWFLDNCHGTHLPLSMPRGGSGAFMSVVDALKEAQDEIELLRRKAVALWDLLDDIDTLDDACRQDDHSFREATRTTQRRRFEIFSLDEIDDINEKPNASLNGLPLGKG